MNVTILGSVSIPNKTIHPEAALEIPNTVPILERNFKNLLAITIRH